MINKQRRNTHMKCLIGSVVIGASIIVGVILKNSYDHSEKLISEIHVEGKAEENIKADLFDWSFTYSAAGSSVQEAKESVKTAKHEIVAILTDAGLVRDEDFIIKPKELSKTKTDDGKDVYTASQVYEVKTPKMDEATRAYKNSESLVDKGISISSSGEKDVYKLKDKSELEKKMRDKALKDAREQAEKIAASIGGKIIGVPGTWWSYVRLKDINASNDSWRGGSSIDQIAILELNTNFKVEKK
jgi:hypothetical protein